MDRSKLTCDFLTVLNHQWSSDTSDTLLDPNDFLRCALFACFCLCKGSNSADPTQILDGLFTHEEITTTLIISHTALEHSSTWWYTNIRELFICFHQTNPNKFLTFLWRACSFPYFDVLEINTWLSLFFVVTDKQQFTCENTH